MDKSEDCSLALLEMLIFLLSLEVILISLSIVLIYFFLFSPEENSVLKPPDLSSGSLENIFLSGMVVDLNVSVSNRHSTFNTSW